MFDGLLPLSAVNLRTDFLAGITLALVAATVWLVISDRQGIKQARAGARAVDHRVSDRQRVSAYARSARSRSVPLSR